jgi:uncharacterized protein (DUF849 family)
VEARHLDTAVQKASSRRPERSIVIQVALNGNRTKSENPAIPFTHDEMAESARQAVLAGAGSVHFHVRGSGGRESIDAHDLAAALNAMRLAAPGRPLGVSTAEWIEPDSAARHRKVAAWSVLPDFASVNFNEPGSVALAELLISRGVGIEAGLGSVLAVENFVGSKIGPDCLRALLEPEAQEMKDAVAGVGFLEAFLNRAGVKIPRLLHGYNSTAWDFIGLAAARGYDTRIGFEDTVMMPDGTPAAGNGEIISEAVTLFKSVSKSRTAN